MRSPGSSYTPAIYAVNLLGNWAICAVGHGLYVVYLINRRTAFGDEAHDYRTLASRHKTETHFRAACQHDQSRLGWLVVAPVDLGRLVRGAFVQMTARDL